MVYSSKKIASTISHILAHVSVWSHLSVKHTTEQVLEFGYKWENMDSDISEMIFLWNMWRQRIKAEKNITTKFKESHRVKERYQEDTIFLLDYLVGNIGRGIYLELLIISVSLDMQI